MWQHRGAFRRLAGIGAIVLAIDLAATTILGTNSMTTFSSVGQPVTQGPAPSSDKEVQAIAILIVGVGTGIGLFAWGSAASRKLHQEIRDAQEGERQEPDTTLDVPQC